MQRISLLPLLILLTLSIFSCKSLVKFRYGNKTLNYLKDAREVNVVFDYSDMSVGKIEDEAYYVSEKVREKNEKEPGEGDAWKEKWYGQRESVFEPEFLKALNRITTDKMGLHFSRNNEDADYTVLVHTLFMEPGFNVGIASKDAKIDVEIFVYEKGNQSDPLSAFNAYDIEGTNTHQTGAYGPGDFSSYSVSGRLGNAYWRCGDEFAEYIDENMDY